MRIPAYLIVFIPVILSGGCQSSMSTFDQRDCPPETIRLNDEHSGNYDCVTRQEYDELLRALEEADETHRALGDRG